MVTAWNDGIWTSPILDVDADSIRPAPENDVLYRPISGTDPEIICLANSIAEHGLREPLVVSRDHFIISGHRRYAAARLAGLTLIPVRYEDVLRREDPERFLVLLREHNRQRVKSFDEKVREAVIDADPEECRAELVLHRRKQAETGQQLVGALVAREVVSIPAVGLARVTERRRVQELVVDLADRQRPEVREVHHDRFQRLHERPFRIADLSPVPDARKLNWDKSRMRLLDAGHWAHIPAGAIDDETRPVVIWDAHPDVGHYIRRELDAFLKGYARDLLTSQPNHVELLVEKNTVASIVRPISQDYTIPMTSGRGYSSLPPRSGIARRFLASGKEKLILVMVTDFDPEGEDIAVAFARSSERTSARWSGPVLQICSKPSRFARRSKLLLSTATYPMRDDLGIRKIEAVKAAITAEQVKAFKLPPQFEAKATSSRAKRFVEKHGTNVWELEALPPRQLQDVVRACVLSALDVDALNHEILAEREDARQLHGMRVAVREALRSSSALQEGAE